MHLLRTETVSLDQTAEAVDLDLTPADILFLSFTDSDLSGVMAAHEGSKDKVPSLRAASLKSLQHPFSIDLLIEKTASKAKFILVRLLGGKDYWSYGVDELARLARERKIHLALVPGDYQKDQRLNDASTLDEAALSLLWNCFHQSGRENFSTALDHIAAHLGLSTAPQDPQEQPAVSRFEEACRRQAGDIPHALLLAYRSVVNADDTAPLIALADALYKRGFAVECLAVSSLKDPAAIVMLEAHLQKKTPDIILNTTAFSAKRDDGTTVLDSCGVPVLQAILATTYEDPWSHSTRGLNAADLAMNVVLPELDGRLVTRAISFKAEAPTVSGNEFTKIIHKSKEDRIGFVSDLALNWVKLARTPNKDKKLALILSDYPHKGGHQAYAVGLDTPASVVAIADDLKVAGYQIADRPNAAEMMQLLCSGQRTEILSAKTYRHLFSKLPQSFRDAVIAAWGPVPEYEFTVSLITCGALLIALQPLRGTRNAQKEDYHDPTRPPTHEYIAFYLWLTRVYQPHALIHCGTHGTLEWLPGKSVALSNECAPEILLGPLPVLYPFIVNNPGEAAQAKRRLAAVTIGHLTPPLIEAGTSGVLTELESLLDEYSTAQTLDPRRASHLADVILTRVKDHELDRDAGLTKDLNRDEQLAALDAFLCDVKEMRIADGLHIFGRASQHAHHDQWIEASFAADQTNKAKALLAQSPIHESQTILSALEGRFVKPGPAGAPSRGRLDVLPTGRNLYTIDPRSVPTRTAWEIGKRTADELIARYMQDHGEAPRSVMLDLWGSASMRTGGDDLAQAMALLGVRPLWDHASSRVNGFEILPPAQFGRARIDVTLRISGLFRDVFPQQIALFDEAVQAVAALDETDDENPLAAKRRAKETIPLRIFGSAPGTFGLGLNDSIHALHFEERDQFGKAYLEANSHAYRASGAALPAASAFATQVKDTDAFVHVQDIEGQDILDSDAYAEHEGGFAAAANYLGNQPTLYHIDAKRGDRPAKIRTIREEMVRVLRGRATNPRWIKGQMRHGYRGATEIAETVRNLFSYAALTDVTESRDFDELYAATLGHDDVRLFLTSANPEAAASIARLFREAETRGYWTSRRNSSRALLDSLLAEAAE